MDASGVQGWRSQIPTGSCHYTHSLHNKKRLLYGQIILKSGDGSEYKMEQIHIREMNFAAIFPYVVTFGDNA